MNAPANMLASMRFAWIPVHTIILVVARTVASLNIPQYVTQVSRYGVSDYIYSDNSTNLLQISNYTIILQLRVALLAVSTVHQVPIAILQLVLVLKVCTSLLPITYQI